MSNIVKIILTAIICFCFFPPMNAPVYASEPQGVFVDPRVIDLEAEAGELIEKSVAVKNNNNRYAEVTPLVYGLTQNFLENTTDATSTDDTARYLASWISVYRGVIRLSPGESVEKPLSIKVRNDAMVGTYYAYVIFSEGKNFSDPGTVSPPYSQTSLLIRLKIKKSIKEVAEIAGFRSYKNVYFKFPAEFGCLLKNIGNEPVDISGSLRIYNRRGEEIEKVDVDQKNILPEQSREIDQSWDPGSGFGKYKAKLVLEYGKNSKRDLQEIIYFWVLPLKFLIFFISGLVFIFILLILILFSKRKDNPTIR
jgi:hypothetical protein